MERGHGLRLFVCGGHDVRNAALVKNVLGAVRDKGGVSFIVESGDRAGTIAREWAHDRAISVLTIFGSEEDWVTSTLKSTRVVQEGRPDLAISFDRSHRSLFYIETMAEKGVKTYVVPDQACRRLSLDYETTKDVRLPDQSLFRPV